MSDAEYRFRGRQHGQRGAMLDHVLSMKDPVTVVTSSEAAASWWRDKLRHTQHAVMVNHDDPTQRLRPYQGRDLYFDMWSDEYGEAVEPE